MDDKHFISEDILRKVLNKLEEIKKQTNQSLRIDTPLLSGLLHQFGWCGVIGEAE